MLRLERDAPPRPVLSVRGTFEGLTWSIDGSVLVVGVPRADQWLFVPARGAGGFDSVRHIRRQFWGGNEPLRGEFPRPVGWCYAEPANRTTSGQPPC
jgi:hypothetical protein